MDVKPWLGDVAQGAGARPVEPLLGVLGGGLVQVELVVQDDVEALLRKVVDHP